MGIKRKTYYIKSTLVSLLIFFLGLGGVFNRWQNYCYDSYSELRLRTGTMETPVDPIIICIDEASLQELGRWPWPRQMIADLITEIASSNPQVVGVDLLFTEESNEKDDKALGAALSLLHNSVLIDRVGLKACYGLLGMRIKIDHPESVIPVLKRKITKTGFADVLPDSDGVIRRVPLRVRVNEEEKKSFVGEILTLTKKKSLKKDFKESLLLTFGRELESFTTISAADLLLGRVSSNQLNNRIVLVGVTAPGLESDQFRIPVAKMGEIPGVFLHAYALATFLSWKETFEVHPMVRLIIILLAGWMGGYPLYGGMVKGRRRALYGFLALTMMTFTLPLIFFLFGIYLDPALLFLAGLSNWLLVFIEEFYKLRTEERRLKELFSKYLSPQVMNQVLRGPRPDLNGQRQTITVLIADLRGFTAFAESKTPEEVVKILNCHLSLMTDIIFTYGGTLDKFLGDAVLALFGAPLSQRDHAQRALAAALAISKLFSENSKYLPVGIGLSTGEAMIGNIGGGKRLEYTAVGDTVNIAARLQELAGPGEIWATVDTVTSGEKQSVVSEWRVMKLRGRETSVRIGIIKSEGS